MGTDFNTLEVTENISKLLELKKNVYEEIYSHEKEISRMKKRLEEIENILMRVCVHSWEYDHCYGMYDKPDKVCKLCESRIYRF